MNLQELAKHNMAGQPGYKTLEQRLAERVAHYHRAMKVENPEVIYSEAFDRFYYNFQEGYEEFLSDCAEASITPEAGLAFVCESRSPAAPDLKQLLTDSMEGEWSDMDGEMIDLPDLADIQALLNQRFEENADTMKLWYSLNDQILDLEPYRALYDKIYAATNHGENGRRPQPLTPPSAMIVEELKTLDPPSSMIVEDLKISPASRPGHPLIIEGHED